MNQSVIRIFCGVLTISFIPVTALTWELKWLEVHQNFQTLEFEKKMAELDEQHRNPSEDAIARRFKVAVLDAARKRK